MTASQSCARPRPRALFALVALGTALFACAGSQLAARQRALEAAWYASAPAPAAAPEAAGVATREAGVAPDALFTGTPFLERAALVDEVLRRNPSLAAARFAWRAALARVPQERALDDPMLGYGLAPASFGSRQVDGSHRFELSQALPFPGKRALRGEIALAEAEAAGHEHASARLRLATMASLLFDDWYLVARELAKNAEHVALLAELREIAIARYEAGLAAQQAPLQAEFEHEHLRRLEIELATAQRVTADQINLLLHRHPDAPLPPPPPRLEPPTAAEVEDAARLARALAERPELRAAEARVRSREAALRLAGREFLPDFRLTAMYDGLWQDAERDLRPFVGVEVNVPLQLSRRRAAVDEARARLEQARHERSALEDEVRVELASGADRLEEAEHLLTHYRDHLLPAAQDQAEAARIGFETGQSDFDAWIAAQRNLRDVELGQEEARTTLSRRSAELERATGLLPAGR